MLIKKKVKGTCISATLETERMILRKFKMSDAEDMFNNYVNDSRVTKFMTWSPHGDIKLTKKLLRGWIKRYKTANEYNWVIVLKENGQVIGSISNKLQNSTGKYGDVPMSTYDTGYSLSADYWGQGLVTEALIATIDYLFNNQSVERIVARHLEANPASGKVMVKAGMKHLYDMEDETAKNCVKIELDDYTLKVYKIEKL